MFAIRFTRQSKFFALATSYEPLPFYINDFRVLILAKDW